MAVIGPVWVDGSVFGSVYIMSGLDSGDFWVVSGGFRWFQVVSDGFVWFQVLSITPHLLLSPSHFQNSLSTFSVERVNGIPLWDFCTREFQRALKIIIIAELFIVMTISPG